MKYPAIIVLLMLFSCSSKIPVEEKESKALNFYAPQKVTVSGYAGDIMEPFIARDGQYLFFNNLNDPSVNTNIFYSERITDSVFQYKGEVQGVNSAALDGVPSMDTSGKFYFVSTRSYTQTFSTIYHGLFDNGKVNTTDIVAGISRQEPGTVNFDVEVSADGNTLYFVDALLYASGQPQSADLVIATRIGTGFQRSGNSGEILQTVNTNQLEYAACISDDELILFFTRVPSISANAVPRIYYATRENKNASFKRPNELTQADGFVEAATISGDSLVYYHKKGNTGFDLYCIKRKYN